MLSKEKYELHSKLDIEKTKLEVSNSSSSNSFINLFRKNSQQNVSNTNDQEYKKLINENIELKSELESFKQKYDEKCQDYDNCKNEYQIIINLQIDKIKKFENNVSDKDIVYEENSQKLIHMYENWKNIDIERAKLENQYFEVQKENKIKEEKIFLIETDLLDK